MTSGVKDGNACQPAGVPRTVPRSLAVACAACAAALALALAPAAHAGGFATVGLDSTPEGAAAGEVWSVRLTVMAHGRTPVPGLQPYVRIASGDLQKSFAAKPTGRDGVYRADVVFPKAGRWTYVVDDGYIDQEHGFRPGRSAPRRRPSPRRASAATAGRSPGGSPPGIAASSRPRGSPFGSWRRA